MRTQCCILSGHYVLEPMPKSHLVRSANSETCMCVVWRMRLGKWPSQSRLPSSPVPTSLRARGQGLTFIGGFSRIERHHCYPLRVFCCRTLLPLVAQTVQVLAPCPNSWPNDQTGCTKPGCCTQECGRRRFRISRPTSVLKASVT